MRIILIYGSSRRNGNSDMLGRMVLDGIPHTELILSDLLIKPIEDKRHTEEGFGIIDDDYDQTLAQVLDHDLIVIATPLYWYGMPGHMKLFFDRWSQSLRDKRFNFRAEMNKKQVYVLLTGGSNPRIKGLPLIQQFQYIFDFVGAEFAGYIIGEADRPGTILEDERVLLEASWLNRVLRQLEAKA